MSERRRPFSDPEVLELFEDEPELLAIVDAIHATQAPRRSQTRRPLLVAGALVATLVLALLIPWQFQGASLTERALAAIGDAQVLHLVASRPEPSQLIIDLETGSARPTRLELESWFDTKSGALRTLTRRNGVVVADTLSRKGAVASRSQSDPVVAIFARSYRSALSKRELQVLRRGRLNGADVTWASLTLPGARRDEVALDAETELPRAFRPVVGSEPKGPLWHVPEIESQPLSKLDLTPKPPPEGPVAGGVESERVVTLNEASRLLAGMARWPGRDVDGLHLDRVVAQALTRRLADGSRQVGAGLELAYAGAAGEFVEVLQAQTPEPAYGFIDGRLTHGFAPIPEDAVALSVPERTEDNFWIGQLRSGGVFLTIRASRRDLVLEAARSLVPLS